MPKTKFPQEELSEEEEERDLFFNIINRFIGYFSRDSQKHTQNETSSEYPFVAMDTRQVYGQLKFVKDYLKLGTEKEEGSVSFLDIGCGIGNVMLFAEQFSFDVFGFEKDQYPYEIAARLHGKEKVMQQDIWDYDDYDKFDVVYYFRPFTGGDSLRNFERMVEEKVRVGTVLIANYKKNEAIHSDERFKRLTDEYPIWQKIAE